MGEKHWVIATPVSWGEAMFEYMFQVSANRIGYTVMSLGQLKIRSHHPERLYPVRGVLVLYERAVEAGLFMGRVVSGGRGVFYVSKSLN